ncbi:hypothetical protein ZPAH1_orf00217 [Aeromonas phage ZPAH1]|nr:hypothetical protein ZPAH1_orf00217 [Aeromonas phage ZPAH1]
MKIEDIDFVKLCKMVDNKIPFYHDYTLKIKDIDKSPYTIRVCVFCEVNRRGYKINKEFPLVMYPDLNDYVFYKYVVDSIVNMSDELEEMTK